MIQEFSKETIEIDNVEYTLFLNRKGLVSWENITKLDKTAKEVQEKYKDLEIINEEPIEVNDETNPFDYSSSKELEEMEKDEKMLRDIYIKFYWIALYENHKLPISEVERLFDLAENEYGLEQLIELANQMIIDSNTNKQAKQIKKLTALKSTK